MAEFIFGAGRGRSELVYLNGGASGIGGGVIAGGRPISGSGGFAGEFGHIRVDSAGSTYDDPESGSLESVVNRAALLSTALRNAVNVLNPQVIVLGAAELAFARLLADPAG